MFDGVVVRLRRERLDWSQAALGQRAGVNKNTITRIEKGRGNRTETVDLVLAALAAGEAERGLASSVVGLVRSPDLNQQADALRIWDRLAALSPVERRRVVDLLDLMDAARQATTRAGMPGGAATHATPTKGHAAAHRRRRAGARD
jgi:transcriptional regulator with XRE-family HTH domain